MIEIDGSYGEGGGQIIRSSMSLAAITGKPVTIQGVRAGREKPGLQPQHLMAVRSAARLCAAEVRGDAVGSMFLEFKPTQPVEAGDYRFDIGTAGSTALVIQTVFLPLSLADGPSTVTVTGGTHNPKAPSADYLQHVFFPAAREAGFESKFAWPRAGFYPAGGGEVNLILPGSAVGRPFVFEDRQECDRVIASVVTSSLPAHIGERGGKVR